MIDVINIKCECGKAPNFGVIGQKPSHCADCALPDMIDVRSPKCQCGRAIPSFWIRRRKSYTFAPNAKSNEMIDVKSKKCKCGKSQPGFGMPGQKPTCCSTCRAEGMIDVCSPRCSCDNIARYGYKGGRATNCFECKKSDMMNVTETKCVGCDRGQPSFSLIGQRPLYCSDCRTSDMINVLNKCKSQFCSVVVGGRQKKKI